MEKKLHFCRKSTCDELIANVIFLKNKGNISCLSGSKEHQGTGHENEGAKK